MDHLAIVTQAVIVFIEERFSTELKPQVQAIDSARTRVAINMFMSWASPRSIPGSFGLTNRFSKRTAIDHHHKGSGFWSKFCYSCAVIILATILWVWAVIVHHIYSNRNIDFTAKSLYMVGATLVSGVIFVIIVYITMTFRPPRRHSTLSTQDAEAVAEAERAHDNQVWANLDTR